MKRHLILIIVVLLSNIAFSQSDAEAYFKKGWSLMQNKNYNEAIEYFTKSIDEIEMGATYVNRGICKGELGDTIGAINDYKKAIELDPKNKYFAYNASINIGYLNYEQSNYSLAKEYYNKAINIDKKNHIAFSYIGDVYYKEEDYENAIENYTKAINLEKKAYNLYFNRAEAYYDNENEEAATKDYTKTIEVCDKYIKKYGSSADVYYYRGLAKYGLDNFKGAIQDFTRALNKDSEYANAYFDRGYAYIEIEKTEEACADFKKAKELGIDTSEEMNEYCK